VRAAGRGLNGLPPVAGCRSVTSWGPIADVGGPRHQGAYEPAHTGTGKSARRAASRQRQRRRATAASPRRSPAVLRARHQRRSLVFVIAAVVAVVAVVGVFGALRSGPALTPLQARIVSIAQSQLGYSTDPSSSYCNKFSAYWESGTSCGNGLAAEEWCADFAAWVWQKAGADVTYQFINGDLNSSSASFYEWGVDHATWHPVGSHYQPKPVTWRSTGSTQGPSPPSMWPWWCRRRPASAGRTWSTATATALASRSSKADGPVTRRRARHWRPAVGLRVTHAGCVTQSCGVYPAGRLIDFDSRNGSRPSGPNSRPTPDCL